jgi:hypothetical protein
MIGDLTRRATTKADPDEGKDANAVETETVPERRLGGFFTPIVERAE